MADDTKEIDVGKVTTICHISLRDPDSGEIILRKRDEQPLKEKNNVQR